MNYEQVMQLKCNEINALPEYEIESAVNSVIDHYYTNGFPYYEKNMKNIRRELEYLKQFDVSNLELPNNELQQNMMGLNTVNTFHPEMWSVRCKNAKTPMEIFQDRDAFFTAIRKRIKYSDTRLLPFNIRKSLKAFGTQAVSNFRPTIAKWVYERFGNNGDVLDPCAGYGGRLFGAFCSGVSGYVGNDPNKVTQNNNKELYSTLCSIDGSKNFRFSEVPFEEFKTNETFDLVFTSPPYFNIEKYSDESTQSWVRYKNLDDWKSLFMSPLVSKSYDFLHKGGHFTINVSDPITNMTVELGKKVFGSDPKIYFMRLSKILGSKKKGTHKTEPIFIWKK